MSDRNFIILPVAYLPDAVCDPLVEMMAMMVLSALEASFPYLSEHIEYEVPPQDLRINLSRVPAIPARKVVTRVRERKETAHG